MGGLYPSAFSLAFMFSLIVLGLSEELPSEEPKKSNLNEGNLLRRTIQPSDRPAELLATETKGPLQLNGNASPTENKHHINIQGEEAARALPEVRPFGFIRQSGPLNILPQGRPLGFRETPAGSLQPQRPDIFPQRDYDILNRLGLPLRSLDETPIRSFYDAGVANTPFGAFRHNNFDRSPFRPDQPFLRHSSQGAHFRPQLSDSGHNGQYTSYPGQAFQGRPLPPPQGSVFHERSFIPQNIQNVIPRKVSAQFGTVADKPVLPQYAPSAPPKPFAPRESAGLYKSFRSPVSFASDNARVAIPAQNTISLVSPSHIGTFADEKPETTSADKPLPLQREANDNNADLDAAVDRTDYGSQASGLYPNSQPPNCHPNKPWEVLLHRKSDSTDAKNTKE